MKFLVKLCCSSGNEARKRPELFTTNFAPFFHQMLLQLQIRRNPKGWFPKGWFWRMFPRNENRNEGTFGCSPGTKNRNEGTFACSPGTKTGTRAHSPKPPFHEAALLSPGDKCPMSWRFSLCRRLSLKTALITYPSLRQSSLVVLVRQGH